MPALLHKLRARAAKAILTPRAYGYFYEGANITRNRSYQMVRAQDADKTAVPFVRTSLLSHARRIVANVGFAKGLVRDCQMFSLGATGLTCKSLSADNAWAKQADDYFAQWCKVCDVSNRFTFRDLQYLSLAAVLVDGDHGVILTETAKGFPKIQFIEGHQFGNDGADTDDRLVDGVRINENGAPLAYRLFNPADLKSAREIDSAAFVHVFEPDRYTGHRGISAFGSVINTLRDLEDWLSYAKTREKHDAALIGWRTAINGTPGQSAWDAQLNASGDPLAPTLEQMLGGTLPTVRPGEGYQFHNNTRPSRESMEFISYLESDVLECLGLPANWKNLHKEGGATLRAALIRAQYRFLVLQNIVADRFCCRVRNWVVAKAAKRGDLPPIPSDWWQHIWRGPAHLTADIAKVNKENREDIKMGLRTLEQDASEAGDNWVEIRDQIELETCDLLDRAKRLSEQHDIPLAAAIELLSQRSPNPQTLAGDLTETGEDAAEESTQGSEPAEPQDKPGQTGDQPPQRTS